MSPALLLKALQSPGGYAAAAAILKRLAINFGGVRWEDEVASYYLNESRPDLFENATVVFKTIAISELEVMSSVRLRKADVSKWRKAMCKAYVVPSIVTTPLGYGFEGRRLILDGHHRNQSIQKCAKSATHVRIAELTPLPGFMYDIGTSPRSGRVLVHIVPIEGEAA